MLYRDGTVQTYHNMATGWEASFVQSVRHYIGVLTGGGSPLLTVQQGRDILRFSIAAEESGRTGRAVEISSTEVP